MPHRDITEPLRANLDTLILNALRNNRLTCWYFIKHMSLKHGVLFSMGVVHPHFQALEQHGYITQTEWGAKITEKGREALRKHRTQLRLVLSLMKQGENPE